MYKCSKCNQPVLIVQNQEPIKMCICSDATILVDMSAETKGFGGLKLGKKK